MLFDISRAITVIRVTRIVSIFRVTTGAMNNRAIVAT